jgi:hypothetical protein
MTPPPATALSRFHPLVPAAFLLLANGAATGAITFNGIRLWAGDPAGPATSEAALIVDWRDGSSPVVWGYRWPSTENRTGLDMLAAILGADPALRTDSAFFPNAISLGSRTRSYDDLGTPSYLDDLYWNYWVNNEVFFHPTDFRLNGHIVAPATSVIPLGDPFSSGRWVESSTGTADRPLADGSWDGFAFGPYGTTPNDPATVPEPRTAGLAFAAIAACFLRRSRRFVPAAIAAAATTTLTSPAGPYPPGPGQPGTDAIAADNPNIRSWAHAVASFFPGPQRKGSSSTTTANYGSLSSILGPTSVTGTDADYPPASSSGTPSAPVLSLGDGGSVTVTFAKPIRNGPGPDFAVFENGFSTGSAVFAELAFVEVSSNGSTFVRFPPVSLTSTALQNGAYSTIDPTNLRNLAGKHPAGWGTPFDLTDLPLSTSLDPGRITHVRLVDVVGSINPSIGSTDSLGNTINDPFPTQFLTSGFDADAVAVLHEAADPWADWQLTHFSQSDAANASIGGPSADPDRDGLPNLAEYALASHPLRSSSPALQISRDAQSIRLSFTRPANRSDVRFSVETSLDGSSWQPIATSANGNPLTATPSSLPTLPSIAESAPPTIETILALPHDAPRRLFRLSFSRP